MKREREKGSTHPRYERTDQYPPNRQQPKSRLHDLLRLKNDMSLRALLRDSLLFQLLPFPHLGASEPTNGRRRFDVGESDQAQRDWQRKGRVSMRERGEREE